MKWLDEIVKRHVKSSIKDVEDKIDINYSQFETLSEAVKVHKLLIEKLALALKEKALELEQSTDNKLVGVYKDIKNDMSKSLSSGRTTVELLKKIAELENVKDKTDARRSTQDILGKLDYLQTEILRLDKNDIDYNRYVDAVNTLNWVLGVEIKNG